MKPKSIADYALATAKTKYVTSDYAGQTHQQRLTAARDAVVEAAKRLSRMPTSLVKRGMLFLRVQELETIEKEVG